MSRKSIYIIAGSIVVVLIIFFAGMKLTSGTEFCGTVCHVMVPYYESHAESMHKYISCSNCHVPENNYAYKVYYKAKSGISHIYHNINGDYPLILRLQQDSEKILVDNCNHCHETTVSKIHSLASTDPDEKKCYQCHQEIAHPDLIHKIGEQAEQKK